MQINLIPWLVPRMLGTTSPLYSDYTYHGAHNYLCFHLRTQHNKEHIEKVIIFALNYKTKRLQIRFYIRPAVLHGLDMVDLQFHVVDGLSTKDQREMRCGAGGVRCVHFRTFTDPSLLTI